MYTNHFFSVKSFATLFLMAFVTLYANETQNEKIPFQERYVSEIEIARMEDERQQIEENLRSQFDETTAAALEETLYGSNASYIDERALYRITSIGSNGSNIELPNGSSWEVRWSDRRTVKSWKRYQEIYFSPGSSLSSYRYTVVNLSTQEQAQVLLASYPWYDSSTQYITDIDTTTGHIQLSNKSYWDVSRFHYKYIAQWKVGDAVMIGVNNGFLSFSNPNIIINISYGKMYIACSPLN